MPTLEHFPYTNFHGMNLDWILKKMAELEIKYDQGVDEKIIERIQQIAIVDSYDVDTETLTIELILPTE